MLAFLNLNLHHEMIYLWHQSFDLAPPGSFDFAGLNVDLLIQVGDDVFIMALKIAIALLSFLMLTDLSLGIIARVMPQMNVFIVGIPLKIALGMFFLSLLVLQLDPVMHDLMKRFIDDAGLLLRQIMAS
jgi:flagellar biosynthetic protein FliR